MTQDDPQLEGVARGATQDPSPDAMAQLEALQARIAGEMKTQQGPWRDMPFLGRFWPMLLALVFGIIMVIVFPMGQLTLWFTAACISAAIATFICFASVFWTTTRPKLSERLSIVGGVVALIALACELGGAFAVNHGHFDLVMTLKCGGMNAVFSLVPLALLIFGLRRSGFPVRALHAAALTAAAMTLASVGIWKKCTPDDSIHLAFGHVLVPALIFPLAAIVVWKLTRQKTTII